MNDLFQYEGVPKNRGQQQIANAPLATRMRPRSLEEYSGQRHLLGEGKLLRRALEADRLSSMIFYGPPGVGKTSLAQVIALHTKSLFIPLSGVEGSVAELRKAVALSLQQANGNALLFIDEIHRLNKAQQDALLPDIEKGTVRLIGATTQNPCFSVIPPLLSRTQLFRLEPLSIEELILLQQTALADKERGLGLLPVDLDPKAAEHLALLSDGDARKCLNALEIAVSTTRFNEQGRLVVTVAIAEESIQQKAVVYDRTGDAHYDVISAFIKSIRGSDPDAAIYWLATMLHAGEDPRFIARRLVILASEDVGMADPKALPLAVAAKEAVDFIGLPEARITLAHATVYLATALKSNSAYMALEKAVRDVAEGRTLAVPKALRDSHYAGAKNRLGHGHGYLYSHDFPGVKQEFLPEKRQYYVPTKVEGKS
ncbi:MAG: replication-associated recombination protein A [Chthoniobacterales bacterium]|nr:replication-associated recombination protein A [Chthoniobacterales bacterium]